MDAWFGSHPPTETLLVHENGPTMGRFCYVPIFICCHGMGLRWQPQCWPFQGLHARLPQSRFISTWSTGLFIGDLLFRFWTNAVWFERLCSIIGFRRGLHETERKLSIWWKYLFDGLFKCEGSCMSNKRSQSPDNHFHYFLVECVHYFRPEFHSPVLSKCGKKPNVNRFTVGGWIRLAGIHTMPWISRGMLLYRIATTFGWIRNFAIGLTPNPVAMCFLHERVFSLIEHCPAQFFFASKPNLIFADVAFSKTSKYIWGFPYMGVPLNHQF